MREMKCDQKICSECIIIIYTISTDKDQVTGEQTRRVTSEHVYYVAYKQKDCRIKLITAP